MTTLKYIHTVPCTTNGVMLDTGMTIKLPKEEADKLLSVFSTWFEVIAEPKAEVKVEAKATEEEPKKPSKK